MSLIVTVIILLILAGVSIRSLTGSKGLINQAKETKLAAKMQDIEDQIDLIVAKCEVKSYNVTMQLIVKQMIKEEIITDESQVNQDTGDITFDDFILEKKLAKYVVTPVEKYYGDKNAVVTNSSYFTFTVDETARTATITGVKDEYAVKAYQNGEATQYTVVIKDGDTYIKDVVIPYEYVDESGKKYTVTGIGASAFQGVTGSDYTNVDERFTSFVLPNTITGIGSHAFNRCEDLNSVKLQKGIKNIAVAVFEYCTSLTSINIPEGVTRISNYAFQWCTSLNSVNIPNTVSNIGGAAFYKCSSLKSIKIPDSVNSIGGSAFANCTNLSKITISKGCTEIKGYAFRYCKNLKSIELPEGITSIELGTFDSCTMLSNINIPDNVTSIGNSAFGACTSLKSIKLPNNLINIGAGAFNSCINLDSINIPDNVISIGENAFHKCTSLININIPSSIKTMEECVFSYWNANQTINCEILESEKPDTWDATWDYYNDTTERKAQLNWGVSM